MINKETWVYRCPNYNHGAEMWIVDRCKRFQGVIACGKSCPSQLNIDQNGDCARSTTDILEKPEPGNRLSFFTPA